MMARRQAAGEQSWKGCRIWAAHPQQQCLHDRQHNQHGPWQPGAARHGAHPGHTATQHRRTHFSRFSARRAFSSRRRALFFLLLPCLPLGPLAAGCAPAGNLKAERPPEALLPSPSAWRLRHHQKPSAAAAATVSSPSAELPLPLDWGAALRGFLQTGREAGKVKHCYQVSRLLCTAVHRIGQRVRRPPVSMIALSVMLTSASWVPCCCAACCCSEDNVAAEVGSSPLQLYLCAGGVAVDANSDAVGDGPRPGEAPVGVGECTSDGV